MLLRKTQREPSGPAAFVCGFMGWNFGTGCVCVLGVACCDEFKHLEDDVFWLLHTERKRRWNASRCQTCVRLTAEMCTAWTYRLTHKWKDDLSAVCFYSCSVEQVSPSFPYRFMRSSMFALDYSIVSRKGNSGTRWFELKAAVMCKSSHCSQEWRRTASLISTLGASLTLVLYLKREQQLSWCSVFEYGVHLQLCRNICYFLSLCFPPALLWPDSEAIKTALC